MQDKPVALVTGANQGIGLQIAKDLAAKNFTVLVGSRDLARGQEAAKTIDGDAHALQLDVTDQASIAAAAGRVRRDFGRLDVLVNNAAISHTGGMAGMSVEEFAKSIRPSNVSLDEVRTVWETNVFGALAVYQAMLPLLRDAPAARIVNVSSGAGSLTRNADPRNPHRPMFGPTYAASKTALNAMTLAMAIELEGTGIKVNAACPGFTKTNLNNYAGTQTVEEGAREPVRLAAARTGRPERHVLERETRAASLVALPRIVLRCSVAGVGSGRCRSSRNIRGSPRDSAGVGSIQRWSLLIRVAGEGGTKASGKLLLGGKHRVNLGRYPAVSIAEARAKVATQPGCRRLSSDRRRWRERNTSPDGYARAIFRFIHCQLAVLLIAISRHPKYELPRSSLV
ncbi:MAG: SDR family NAD(P)-dependent oxidoreductase [Steroidobacteraceae bacterium]